MKKNTQVETAQKSQATNKIQPENVVKDLKKIDDIRKNKSKVPTGKVTLIKETESRKKAREKQYESFRVNALRRRCKRMDYTEEQTEEFVKKLLEQIKAPKQYSILIMLDAKDSAMMKESLSQNKIQYKYHGDTYFSIDGDQNILAKIREIAPSSAKIHPYAKKMESVLTERPPEKDKKPSSNTAEAKTKAKAARKEINSKRGLHKKHSNKSLAKNTKRKTLLELKKKRKATTVQLNAKKSSTGSKKASTNVKKAA